MIFIISFSISSGSGLDIIKYQHSSKLWPLCAILGATKNFQKNILMGLFDKLFGNKKKNDTGPMPTRNLNFQFTPTPDNGLNFSEQFRDAVRKNENIELDFSVDTLKFTDNFLQRFRDEGLSVNDFAETIFVAGCYVGQVMVYNNGGEWIKQEDANLPNGVTMMPIVIKLPNGTITDPIAKSFKRFHNGDVDSIPYYYHVFTSDKL